MRDEPVMKLMSVARQTGAMAGPALESHQRHYNDDGQQVRNELRAVGSIRVTDKSMD